MQNKQQSKQEAGAAFWERMEQLMNGEEPFAWAARYGINKSTFQSSRSRRTRPLSNTLQTWADAIGCDPIWLKEGIGEAYPQVTAQPVLNAKNDSTGLDLQVLEISIETLEAVLEQTRRKMSPKQKSHLILAIYQLYANAPHPDEMRPTIEMLIRSAA